MVGIGMGFDEDPGDADGDRGARQHRHEFALAARRSAFAARLLYVSAAHNSNEYLPAFCGVPVSVPLLLIIMPIGGVPVANVPTW